MDFLTQLCRHVATQTHLPINVPVAVLEAFVLAHKDRVLQLLGVDESPTLSPAYSKFDGLIESPESYLEVNDERDEYERSPNQMISDSDMKWSITPSQSKLTEDALDSISYDNESNSCDGETVKNSNREFKNTDDSNGDSYRTATDTNDDMERIDTSFHDLPVNECCRLLEGHENQNQLKSTTAARSLSSPSSFINAPTYTTGLRERIVELDESCKSCVHQANELDHVSGNSANSLYDYERAKLIVDTCVEYENESLSNSITINRHKNVGRTHSGVLPGTYQLTNLQDWGASNVQSGRHIPNSISMGSLKDLIHRCSGPLMSTVRIPKTSVSDIKSKKSTTNKKRPEYILLNPDYQRVSNKTINMPRSTSMPTASNTKCSPPLDPAISLTNINNHNETFNLS